MTTLAATLAPTLALAALGAVSLLRATARAGKRRYAGRHVNPHPEGRYR